MNRKLPYVVSEVLYDKKTFGTPEHLYYCHMRKYPNIPIFGSIGTKQHAMKYAKMYNSGASCGSMGVK